MTEKRVLMLGPGEPSVTNSGLGKAAEQIANYLTQHVQLTVIEPEQLNAFGEHIKDQKEKLTTAEFSDFKVLSEMAKISVSGSISPYWSSTTSTSIEKNSTIKDDLEKFSLELVEAAKALSFDVIYAHDWLTFRAGMEIKQLSDKPLVLHVHSLDYDRNARYTDSWVFELEKEAFNMADVIVCVSNYSKNILIDIYNVPIDKIHVIYNGFEHAQYPEFKSPYQESIVLFVGRLTGQKGPTQFLEIAEKVHQRYENSRFIMAGEGEMYQSLIEAGAHSDVAHKFHMTGYLEKEELLKLYAMSDVFCMPSVSEPFGLTAIEAAGAGLPQVISKNSGAAEVLDGVIAVDFNDTEGFAAEIVRFIKNGSHRKNCVHLSQKSLQNLTWQNTGQAVFQIIAEA